MCIFNRGSNIVGRWADTQGKALSLFCTHLQARYANVYYDVDLFNMMPGPDRGPMKGAFPTPDTGPFFPSDTDIQPKINDTDTQNW